MRKYFLVTCFFLMKSPVSFGQASGFDTLSDEMFFNILLHKPDTTVFDFVYKYFPSFTKPYKPGGWTMYPSDTIPILEHTVHSLIFDRHPFFDAKFNEGRLDVFATAQKNEPLGLADIQLWFMFDNKADAQDAFTKLCNMFGPLSKSKRIFERNGKTIAEYSDKPIFDKFSSVEFILTKDELQDDKYKLFFRIGSFTYSE